MWARRGRSRDGQRLIRESEAFLSGRISAPCGGGNPTAPAWVELNWLAHRLPEDVAGHVLAGSLDELHYGSWAWAVQLLGEALVQATGGHPDRIAYVQRHCIVPMELALLAPGPALRVPAHLVALGVPRIRHCASSMREPEES